MRMDDRLVEVAVAEIRPHDRVQAQLEVVRRRRRVLSGDVFDRDEAFGLLLEQEKPAGLVRELGLCVRDDRGPHDGRDHHQMVVSIDSATSSSGTSQKSALRYFQPPSARIVTTTPSSSSSASRLATWIAAPEETPPRMPSRLSSSRTAVTDSSFDTSTFRSSFATSRIGGT